MTNPGVYIAVLSARYRMLLQYRAAAFAGFMTQLFWGAVRLMILAGFMAAATGDTPMTMTEIVAYVWLGQALLGMLPWNVEAEFQREVNEGSIAYQLLRPVDLYAFWYSRAFAFRTATTTLRAGPMLVFAGLVLPLVGLGEWALVAPPSWASGFFAIVSILMAVLLSSAITTAMHITMLWTIAGFGITRLVAALVTVLSGMVIPLPLYPDWMQGILTWQPFRGLVDVPFRIYSGSIEAAAAPGEIAAQLIWTLLIIAFGVALLRFARPKLVVQGG